MPPRRDPTNEQLTQAMAQLAQVVTQQANASAAMAAAQAQRDAEEHARRAQRMERERNQDQIRMRTDFNRHNPPKFEGETEPEKADLWVQEIEKIFEALQTPARDKVSLATFMLKGDAEYWWRSARLLMNANQEAITWDSFKRVFMDKYFPETAREEMENQFLRLRQGTMTVGEYAAKLESLSRYFRFFQAQVDEGYLCNRFMIGLRNEIEESVRPLGIRIFQQLVEKSREVEAMKNRRGSKQGSGGPIRPSHSDHEVYGKKKQLQKKPYEHQRGNGRDLNQDVTKITSPEDQESRKKDVTCFKCGKEGHYASACKGDSRVCFKCQKPGHIAKDCHSQRGEVGVNASSGMRPNS